MKRIKSNWRIVCIFILSVSLLGGCATSATSVKGTSTTVNTLGGDSHNAIVLVDNMWEGAKIAKIEDNNYVLYANIITNGNAVPGSLIIYVDGNKNNLSSPNDWNIDDVSVSQYNTAKYWSTNTRLPELILDSIRNSKNIKIRVVNGNAYMGVDEGLDLTSILPLIKDFIAK